MPGDALIKASCATLVISAISVASIPAVAADYTCKTVGNEWVWFSDHIVGSITYLIVGAPGRTFEAGTGIFAWGRPRGSRQNGTGTLRVTAIGVGALHIRQQGAGDAFKVCATSVGMEAITIINAEF